MSKITLDNLSDNLKEYLEGLGLSEEQVLNLINENGLDEEELKAMLKDTMSINELSTNSKTVIGAINELFQSANNGKQLIANAIGEPLSSEDTFSAMSNDINGLLSTFKTNMMNNGVTVESGDKFKSLIDKIATMVEEGEGKGIQFAEGTLGNLSVLSGGYQTNTNVTMNLDFIPNYIFINMNYIINNISGNPSITNMIICNMLNQTVLLTFGGSETYSFSTSITNLSSTGFTINISGSNYGKLYVSLGEYYAIGVGEEDTTLRDSLASILTDEGVSVTEEDDMASLISKVDTEFTNDNNVISEMETDAENTRSTLAGLMQEGGYDITGDESIDSLLELLVLSGISVDDIKQIACGGGHTFILKNDGSVWSCGYNNYGQLGLNDNTNRTTFTQVTTNINNDVKQIACGYYHTFILKNDGSVWSCGNNENEQLGLNDTTKRTSFTQVTTNINNDVKQIVCGSYHTFILKNDGSVYSCGDNYYGQLGLGDYTDRSSFTQVTTNINNDVEQLACGYEHTFILKNDGSVWSCGRNYYGQLGLGNTTNQTTFTQVTTNINNDVKQIACSDGGNHTFILKNDGSVWSCGENGSGQLGLGHTSAFTSFTQVTTNINNDVKQISCGYNHTFILKNDDSVWSCGYNYYGQLGIGNTTTYTSFTQVTTNINNDVEQLACGGSYTFILKNDGNVYGCGYNGYGQLGLSDTNYRTTFTMIPRGLY